VIAVETNLNLEEMGADRALSAKISFTCERDSLAVPPCVSGATMSNCGQHFLKKMRRRRESIGQYGPKRHRGPGSCAPECPANVAGNWKNHRTRRALETENEAARGYAKTAPRAIAPLNERTPPPPASPAEGLDLTGELDVAGLDALLSVGVGPAQPTECRPVPRELLTVSYRIGFRHLFEKYYM